MCAINYDPVIEQIKQDLAMWKKIPFTLVGKVNVVRMMCLSRLMYLFQHLQVIPPARMFRDINGMVNIFLWQGKPARLSRETLEMHRYDGGLGLPAFEKYYLAAQADLMRRMNVQGYRENNLGIKHLMYLKGLRKRNLGHAALHINLIGTKLFQGSKENQVKVNIISESTPIVSLSGITNVWVKWARDNWPMAQEIVIGRFRGMTVREVTHLITGTMGFPMGMGALLPLITLRVALNPYLGRGNPCIRDMNNLESFMENNMESKVSIVAPVYRLLNLKQTERSINMWQKWQIELGVPIEYDQQVNMWVTAMASLKSSYQRLILYKTLYQIYITPLKINKWNSVIEDKCGRCKINQGSMIHLMWKCPKLHLYWQKIGSIVQKILGPYIIIDISMAIPQIIPGECNLTRAQLSFFHMAMVAAKKIILTKWKQMTPPGIEEWISEMIKCVGYIQDREESGLLKVNHLWNQFLDEI